jgi:hypothetical protein
MVTLWITARSRSTPLVRARMLVDVVVVTGTGAMIAMVAAAAVAAAEADPAAAAAVVDETGVAAAEVVRGAIKSPRPFIR